MSLNDSVEMQAFCVEFKRLNAQYKSVEARLKYVKEQIKTISKGRKIISEGVQVDSYEKKGTIDYKKIPIIKEMHEDETIESYRKKPSVVVRITVIGDAK